ncbi:hypothetical protein Tco_0267133, partial [Tanacetum coccineum]
IRKSCAVSKRRRSPVTSVTTTTHTPAALAPARADLLPIQKRFRGSAFDYETSVEDGMEAAAEAESEIVDFESHAQVGVEAEIKAESKESDGDMIEIGVDVVHPEPETPSVFCRREREEVAEVKRNTLCATIRLLGDIETRLHSIVRDEREARARIKRHLGLVQEELR